MQISYFSNQSLIETQHSQEQFAVKSVEFIMISNPLDVNNSVNFRYKYTSG